MALSFDIHQNRFKCITRIVEPFEQANFNNITPLRPKASKFYILRCLHSDELEKCQDSRRIYAKVLGHG